jgi:hypothetical protein
MLVTGWIVSILPAGMLLFSGAMKLAVPGAAAEASKDIGWQNESVIFALGIVETACVIIYLIPQTSVLGAILMTGYLGGAVAAHVRVGEVFVLQVVLGILVWAGLWLRDARIRAIVPWRP